MKFSQSFMATVLILIAGGGTVVRDVLFLAIGIKYHAVNCYRQSCY